MFKLCPKTFGVFCRAISTNISLIICHFISHNIHGLLHLVDDYHLHGPLDNCSAFTFENYMKELKGMLRKHETPLQQIVRRYEERCNTENIEVIEPLQFTFRVKEPDCFSFQIVKILFISLKLVQKLTP